MLRHFPQGAYAQAPFDRYTSYLLTFCKTLLQPMSSFRAQYATISETVYPLIASGL